MLFIEYPKCGTCKKAKAWLDQHEIKYTQRHIVENPPTAEELTAWKNASGMPLTKFMNTSGVKYRELGLAQKRKEMTDQEIIDLLATDGMLVKRPILIKNKNEILTGFRVKEWEEMLLE